MAHELLTDVPEGLRTSIERLMLESTEALDPLVALQLTNLTMHIVEVVYQMGQQDARLASS